MSKSITRNYVFRDSKGIFVRRKTATAVTQNNAVRSQITSESLTTAAAAVYTLTLTNNLIKADSLVMASVKYGGSTTGTPAVAMVTPADGSVVIKIQNIHASAAFNGTIVVDVYLVRNSPAN
ncbi:MAG: hypothetical protein V4478_03320 [Patescibacteria group bacterium]